MINGNSRLKRLLAPVAKDLTEEELLKLAQQVAAAAGPADAAGGGWLPSDFAPRGAGNEWTQAQTPPVASGNGWTGPAPSPAVQAAERWFGTNDARAAVVAPAAPATDPAIATLQPGPMAAADNNTTPPGMLPTLAQSQPAMIPNEDGSLLLRAPIGTPRPLAAADAITPSGDPRSPVQSGPVDPWIFEQPKTAAEAEARIAEMRNTEMKREPKFWKRLGKGLMDGLIAFSQMDYRDSNEGIGKLIGALGASGGVQAFSPGAHAELRKAQQIRQMLGQRDQMAAREMQKAQIEYQSARPEIEKAKLRNRIEIETQRFNNRMNIIRSQQDYKAGEWKEFIDENGYVFKRYLKPGADGKVRPMEPLYGPDGSQEFVPGYQQIAWTNPQTGEPTLVRAKDLLQPITTLQNADANRGQQAAIVTANNEMDAQKTNIRNEMDYQNQMLRLMEEQSQAESKEIEGLGEMRGLRDRMATLSTQLDQVPEYDTDNRNKILTEFAKVQAEFEAAAGKNAAASAARQKLAVQGINPPGKVTPVKVEPVLAATKPAPVTEDVFRARLKAAQPPIPPAQWPAIIAKARADGVIR